MTEKSRKLWVWGYVADNIPEDIPFTHGKSYCSLETAMDYMGASGAVFMNSNHDVNSLTPPRLNLLPRGGEIICALEHGKYAESAACVSRMSLERGNVKGAIIDDFLDWHGPSANMKPGELRDVRQELKSANPALKLYVVRYTWQKQEDILPYSDYFDVINLWVWNSTAHYWNAEYDPELDRIKRLTEKPVLQGLFINDYSGGWPRKAAPVPLDLLKLQAGKIFPKVRSGTLDGCVILQNGWFDHPDYFESLLWLKNYSEWFFGTTTMR